jgi:hypothetical protein
MARRRSKTKVEKAEEWREKKRNAYVEFRSKLESLQSYEQGELLLQAAPSQINPAHTYYANLGFFLHHFAAPDSASRDELALYLELARKMDAAGELKGASLHEIEESLRRAMELRTE